MFKFLPVIFIFIILACQPEERYLSTDQLEAEKKAVINVINAFNQANEEENFSAMVPYLADEVIFFGTDSSEVIKTFAEFKEAMSRQWETYDKFDFGEMTDISIQMDPEATLASIIYGIPCQVKIKDTTHNYFLRVSRTLQKQKTDWVIVSGIVNIVRDDVNPANIQPIVDGENTTE